MDVLTRSAGRRVLLAALLWASAGCVDAVRPEDRPRDIPLLFAVLTTGSDTAHVLLQRLREVGGIERVSGARIFIEGPAGPATLTEQAPGLPRCLRPAVPGSADRAGEEGCYSGLLPTEVREGDAWQVVGELPDGGRFGGRLVAPGTPVVRLDLDPGDERQEVVERSRPDGLPVVLESLTLASAPRAERVEVRPFVLRAFAGGVALSTRLCSVQAVVRPMDHPRPPEREEVLIHGATCRDPSSLESVEWDSVDVGFVAAAYEANLAAYAREMLNAPALALDRAGFGVDGMAGVFGAAAVAPVEETIRLICGPECKLPFRSPEGP